MGHRHPPTPDHPDERQPHRPTLLRGRDRDSRASQSVDGVHGVNPTGASLDPSISL